MDTTAETCIIPTPTSSSSSSTSTSSTLLHWASSILQNETHWSDFLNPHLTIDLVSTLFKMDNTTMAHMDTMASALAHIHSLVPEIFTDIPSTVDLSAYEHGDQNQIIPLLAFIQTEYQVYYINYIILSNPELSFTAHVHQFISIPTTNLTLENHLLSWCAFILSDYMNASFIAPMTELSYTAWKNGHNLLCVLHYHHPSLVPDLHLSLQQAHVFETAIQCIHTLNPSFHTSCKTMIPFLIDLLSCLKIPNKEKTMQRHRDLERFKIEFKSTHTQAQALHVAPHSTPSLSHSEQEEEEEEEVEGFETFGTSTTMTSTYTLQQLKITKTTITKYSDGTEIPSDLEEFESRATALTERINGLQHRLILIVPTRSSSYSPSSVASDSMMEFFLTDDNTSSTRTGDNSSHHSLGSNEDALQLIQQQQQQQRRLLHPLQAAEEDYAAYDRNFKALQSEFQALTDGDLHLLLQVYVQEELEPVWRDHPKVLWRQKQLLQLHGALNAEFERSECTLSSFRRGFAFARMCGSIRQELDLVQHKMVKSITTHHDIQELEDRMQKTTGMVDTLKTNFDDLLLLASDATAQDTSYLSKYEAITGKNELVRTWVEEVRVWFAEAARIRQWIEMRIEQLDSTTLPDPLATVELPASREQVELLNASHSVLEKEIEAFDSQDMARLRSHVKTLTGSGRADKDLSPADTTTIEITLTTLMTLDKLIHLLRKKSYDLQVLTERVLWEEEYVKAMAWLKETDSETDAFLNTSARWRAAEEEEEEEEEAAAAAATTTTPSTAPSLKRERLMAREKQKEVIVQQLLTLERKMAEFDQGQFTKTVDSFQDLDNTSSVELPAHLESRQDACEQLFEDLMKRMAFARNVVEQRLNVMDFLYQTDMVMQDAAALQLDLADAGAKARPGDNDREMTARVQHMHERIVQLVTATAGRIPYPVPGLAMDKGPNAAANEEISQVITKKRNDLISASEHLDERLLAFRNVLQLHKRAKEHLDEAARLCDWADERIKMMRRAKASMQHDDAALTADDVQRLERDRDSVLGKLKHGKENEVVDLLTRIQLLLETAQQLEVSCIDTDGLVEVSQQLEERFDRLQHILEEHGLELEALRKKMQDGNTYFEHARSLRSFISDTRHSMPGLKQTCGFMTGQSEEQDNRRFDMLRQSLSTIHASYQEQQAQFSQLCARFKVIEPSKVENMDTICSLQRQLELDWAQLADEIKDLEQFAGVVGQWYDRQRRLSMVENELLVGLNEEITQLAKTGSSSWVEADLAAIQNKIDKASRVLQETGQGIRAADNKEDPLQTANYSCARDRHSMLTNKVTTAQNHLKALQSNANKTMAFSAFLSASDTLLSQVQAQKEAVGRRMAVVGNSGFAGASMASIDTMCKDSQASSLASEQASQTLVQGLESLMAQANALQAEGYDAATVHGPVMRIKDNLQQLSNTIGLEKKQAMFMRKIYIHAKAANDLSAWISHCADAIEQLPTDVCMHDEHELRAELDSLEQKMTDMRPTMQAFQAMASRIFVSKDGLPVDVCEISLDRNQVKQAVNKREAAILQAWQDLQKQHAKARALMDNSKRGVEVARKVKSILTQVGDLKDRVSAVRICRNTQLDEGMENRDLKTVLSCPLTSIPNEHRLASAKAELAILDRDCETHLQPSIHELDGMLSAMQGDHEDIFSGQRTEITIAVRGLMDLIKTKRRAIAEAEKMEGFLTVMEELEVLLLALTEVVSRASPENARIVDGNYSRTDLQALLIDLDTRYRYYEPKINELMEEAQQVAENLMDDRRVVDCLRQLADKWSQIQAEAAAKKADLMERIGPLAATFDTLEAREGMLQERGRRAASLVRKSSTPVLKQPPSPKTMQSTPRYMTGYNRTTANRNNNNTTTPVPFAPSATAARANARRTAGGTVSPTARRVAARQHAALQQRQRVTSTATAPMSTPDTYVADPKNDLDVALGDIINDSPYKVLVKMVPGEVGKYWFGDVNPKLAYCRILRSRMVMVRVGGGWVELSQFLSDHALLEGGQFVSHKGSRASLPPMPASSGVTVDGFLNTTVGRNAPSLMNRNANNNNGMVSIRGGGGGGGGGSHGPAVPRESRSTPYHHRGISPGPGAYGHGIKTGNKFLVTVDGDGNRVEVKMTKAKSKEAKFVTPRRIHS